MRTLLTVTVPVEKGNQAIGDGSLPRVIQQTMERIKPESAVFTADASGQRTAYMVFDLKDVSDIPSIGEPLFITLNASLTFTPVMNVDELKAGLGKYIAAK